MTQKSSLSIPEYAPLWLNLGDGGILHVFKLQVFLEFGLIYAYRHRHVSIAVQGGMGSACKPLASSPKVMTGCKVICTYLDTKEGQQSVLHCEDIEGKRSSSCRFISY